MSHAHHPPHLLLRNLILALSYYGVTVRLLLIGFVLFVANLIGVLDVEAGMNLSQLAFQYIYTLGSLLLLDAGYVTIARTLPIANTIVDKLVLLVIMAFLCIVIIIPFFAPVTHSVFASTKWLFLIVLFVLALRLVIGLFFGQRTKR